MRGMGGVRGADLVGLWATGRRRQFEVLGRCEAVTAMPWMPVAFAELLADVREIPGDKSNPRILEYLATTTLGGDGVGDDTAWCSAFVNFCLRMARVAGTNSAAARSWLAWGQASDPRVGSVCVLWRGSLDGWQGHVGFVLGWNGGAVHLLGGNQGDRVSVQSFPIGRVLGYREPKLVEVV